VDGCGKVVIDSHESSDLIGAFVYKETKIAYNFAFFAFAIPRA